MTLTFEGKALRWRPVDGNPGVMEVVLHGEPANEIGTVMLAELETLASYLADGADGARALVLSSELGAFCAGADLRELQAGMADALEAGASQRALRGQVASFITRVHEAFDRIDMAPLTTVAAVHGACLGGGFELALLCDVIVADKSARFGFPELRLGLVPGFGGIPRLTRDVGNAVARDLLFTGRSVRATRMAELGVVSQVVGRGQARDVALRVAEQACRFDQEAFRSAKAFTKPLPSEALARERETFLDLVTRPVVFEALTDFVRRDGSDALPYLPAKGEGV